MERKRNRDHTLRRCGAALLALTLLLALPPARAQAADSEWQNIVDVVAGDGYTVALRDDGRVLYTGRREADDPYEAEEWTGVERLELEKHEPCYLVGYFRDGSVRVAGPEYRGRFDLSKYSNVAHVEFAGDIAVLLHKDGRVHVAAAEGDGARADAKAWATAYQLGAASWTDVVQVCFGGYGLLGLTRDGDVLCTDKDWEAEHADWKHVIRLYPDFSWALRRDGTVLGSETFEGGPWTNVDSVYIQADSYFALTRDGRVLVGYNGYLDGRYLDDKRLIDVLSWTDVVQLGFDVNGWARFVPAGLRADGTVVVPQEFESSSPGVWNTSDWTGVKRLYSGAYYTYGLHADGTVLGTAGEYGRDPVVDEVRTWTQIAALYPSQTVTGESHIVGLRFDGTLIAAGWNEFGQCDVR